MEEKEVPTTVFPTYTCAHSQSRVRAEASLKKQLEAEL